jgi:ABC-2 type transport system ATP-binding protein
VPALAISTQSLRKVFGEKIAVRGLTLGVRRGEVFGFLGPNGAGKSTSLKMLLGLAAPTSGNAEVLGQPIGHTETRQKIGFLPEHFRFYEWLTAAELLHLHGRLYGIPAEGLRQRVPAMLDTVGLTPHSDKQLRHFSKGMLQRIGLAQARSTSRRCYSWTSPPPVSIRSGAGWCGTSSKYSASAGPPSFSILICWEKWK